MTTNAVRQELIEYLRKELVGPAPGFPAIQINKEEMLRSQDPPRLRYSAGILFPMRSEVSDHLDIEEKELRDAGSGPSDEPSETEVTDGAQSLDSDSPTDQQPETDFDLNLANQYLPSAMGISALIKMPQKLVVRIDAARYEKTEVPGFGRVKTRGSSTSYAWLRKPLLVTATFNGSELLGESVISLEKAVPIENSDSRLTVNVVSRPHKDGRGHQNARLVTITLINRNESPRVSNDELCFFQCRFEISAADAGDCFLEYPDRTYTEDFEERSLRFLYRNRKVFAVGHGCSCDWLENAPGHCSRVWTASLPFYEVKPIEHVDLPGVSFSMKTLSEDGPETIRLCETLAAAYKAWINDQRQRIADRQQVPTEYRRCRRGESRTMRELSRTNSGRDRIAPRPATCPPCVCVSQSRDVPSASSLRTSEQQHAPMGLEGRQAPPFRTL